MSAAHSPSPPELIRLPKAATGIAGLDEITGGGLPRGRPTLVCGSAGCGKTLFGLEFLVRGATEFGEPGVFMAFEETADELTQNVASLGFDLHSLGERRLIHLDHVRVERSEIEETGQYDLDGLFLRLGYAIDQIGARRVVLDTLETLFAAFSNESILRAELRRLFRWLKDRGVTTVITAERGSRSLTRQGLEEYVSDCVILLDHRVQDQVSTRRLRVVKYRGTAHGTDEYPFLIDADGFSVLPVTALQLDHAAPAERISTGVPQLDAMLGGEGFYRGSSVLISGTAGSGKSSLAAHALDAACRRGERAVYFTFEESPAQIMRNMRSIGLILDPWVREGLLRFEAARPTVYGLEMHLAVIHRLVERFRPSVVVVDPISNFIAGGTESQVRAMLMRLIDFLKHREITGFFTSLTPGGDVPERTEVGVSSLMDAWLLLRCTEEGGERTRGLYVLKARGMAHSHQVRELRITRNGLQVEDVYLGPQGVLTGSARRAQEAREQVEARARREAIRQQQQALQRRRTALEAQIAALRAEFEEEAEKLRLSIDHEEQRERVLRESRRDLAWLRQADSGSSTAGDA